MNDHATDPPTLAVVGHPNKGKSSLVATLAERPDIAIDAQPGTTQTARRYPVQIDQQTRYILVDTPGFERPRAALEWLNAHAASAADHPRLVGEFLKAHAGNARFSHECELLRPVVDGAGILYVVDGSVPYGPEYEAEMEVLRWTGRPRMALINPIGRADHVDEWRNALGQYFNNVYVFDALDASFDRHVAMLEACAQLDEAWRRPLNEAAKLLRQRRQRRHREAARAIAEMTADMLWLTVDKRLGPNADPKRHEPELAGTYRDRLRQRERQGRAAVESIYAHARLHRRESDMPLEDVDLFSTSHWTVFGLSRRQLTATGAAGGAVAGGMLDAGFGGMSFLAGSIIGAVVGGTSGWYGAQRLERMRVMNRPLGGKRLICGPIRSANFPYVVLGRALHHHTRVAGRSHAARRPLELDDAQAASGDRWFERLTANERKRLTRLLRQFTQGRTDDWLVAELAELIEPLLADR